MLSHFFRLCNTWWTVELNLTGVRLPVTSLFVAVWDALCALLFYLELIVKFWLPFFTNPFLSFTWLLGKLLWTSNKNISFYIFLQTRFSYLVAIISTFMNSVHAEEKLISDNCTGQKNVILWFPDSYKPLASMQVALRANNLTYSELKIKKTNSD